MSRGARRFVQTFVSLVGAEVVTRIMLLAAAVIVVRSLTPAAFGEYAYAVAAGGLAAFMVDLGLGSLVVRDMSVEPERAPFLLGAFIKAQAVMVPTRSSAYVHPPTAPGRNRVARSRIAPVEAVSGRIPSAGMKRIAREPREP